MPAHRIGLVQFMTDFQIGGTERQAVNLARGLDASTFSLHIGCFRRFGALLAEMAALGLPVTDYPINSLYNANTAKQALRLARYLREHRIQIVHTHNFYPNMFAIPVAWLAGVPVRVASVRDTGELWTPMQRRAQRVICRLATRVVVNAEAIRQRLIAEGYPEDKIILIRNGLDLSRFARRHSAAKIRRQCGLPPHVHVAAVISRLHPMKGIEDFLEAARIVVQRVRDAYFLIVGGSGVVRGGEYREELRRYAVRLGLGHRVVFAGYRLDTTALLSAVSVSVLPSLCEGLSNVLLESMAAGVPVVATRVGGNPEAVAEGVNGFLVPPRDPGALADAICRLLEDRELAARFGQEGKRRIAHCFSLERMVGETERLYWSLLTPQGPVESDIREKRPLRKVGS